MKGFLWNTGIMMPVYQLVQHFATIHSMGRVWGVNNHKNCQTSSNFMARFCQPCCWPHSSPKTESLFPRKLAGHVPCMTLHDAVRRWLMKQIAMVMEKLTRKNSFALWRRLVSNFSQFQYVWVILVLDIMGAWVKKKAAKTCAFKTLVCFPLQTHLNRCH